MSLPDLIADFEWLPVNGELGHGTFGVVRLAKLRATGELMAVKCFNKCVPREAALREAALLLSLTHPNVVHYHGIAGGDAGMYLVMEYCVLGNVQSHRQTCGYAIPLDMVRRLPLTCETRTTQINLSVFMCASLVIVLLSNL